MDDAALERYRDILDQDTPDFAADTSVPKSCHDQLIGLAGQLPDKFGAALVEQLQEFLVQVDTLGELSRSQNTLEQQLGMPSCSRTVDRPKENAVASKAGAAVPPHAASNGPQAAITSAQPSTAGALSQSSSRQERTEQHQQPQGQAQQDQDQQQQQQQPREPPADPKARDAMLASVLALADHLNRDQTRALAQQARCSEEYVRNYFGNFRKQMRELLQKIQKRASKQQAGMVHQAGVGHAIAYHQPLGLSSGSTSGLHKLKELLDKEGGLAQPQQAGLLLAQMHANPDTMTRMAQLRAILASSSHQTLMTLATAKLLELLGTWLKKAEADAQLTLIRLMLRVLGHVAWPPAMLSGNAIVLGVQRLIRHPDARIQQAAAQLLFSWRQAGVNVQVKHGTLTDAALRAVARAKGHMGEAAGAAAAVPLRAPLARPGPRNQYQKQATGQAAPAAGAAGEPAAAAGAAGAAAAAPGGAGQPRPTALPRPWIGTAAGAAAAAAGAAGPSAALRMSSKPITADQATRKKAGMPRDAIAAALAMDGPALKRQRLRPHLPPTAQQQLLQQQQRQQQQGLDAAALRQHASQPSPSQHLPLDFFRHLGPVQARQRLQQEVAEATAKSNSKRRLQVLLRVKTLGAEKAEQERVRAEVAAGQAAAPALLPWHQPPLVQLAQPPKEEEPLQSSEAARLQAEAAAWPPQQATGPSPASPVHSAADVQHQQQLQQYWQHKQQAGQPAMQPPAGLEPPAIPLYPEPPEDSAREQLELLEKGVRLEPYLNVDRALAALFAPPAAVAAAAEPLQQVASVALPELPPLQAAVQQHVPMQHVPMHHVPQVAVPAGVRYGQPQHHHQQPQYQQYVQPAGVVPQYAPAPVHQQYAQPGGQQQYYQQPPQLGVVQPGGQQQYLQAQLQYQQQQQQQQQYMQPQAAPQHAGYYQQQHHPT